MVVQVKKLGFTIITAQILVACTGLSPGSFMRDTSVSFDGCQYDLVLGENFVSALTIDNPANPVRTVEITANDISDISMVPVAASSPECAQKSLTKSDLLSATKVDLTLHNDQGNVVAFVEDYRGGPISVEGVDDVVVGAVTVSARSESYDRGNIHLPSGALIPTSATTLPVDARGCHRMFVPTIVVGKHTSAAVDVAAGFDIISTGNNSLECASAIVNTPIKVSFVIQNNVAFSKIKGETTSVDLAAYKFKPLGPYNQNETVKVTYQDLSGLGSSTPITKSAPISNGTVLMGDGSSCFKVVPSTSDIVNTTKAYQLDFNLTIIWTTQLIDAIKKVYEYNQLNKFVYFAVSYDTIYWKLVKVFGQAYADDLAAIQVLACLKPVPASTFVSPATLLDFLE